MIPKKLQKDLPYELKPKVAWKKEKKIEGKLIARHTALILEPKESKVNFCRNILAQNPIFTKADLTTLTKLR